MTLTVAVAGRGRMSKWLNRKDIFIKRYDEEFACSFPRDSPPMLDGWTLTPVLADLWEMIQWEIVPSGISDD